VVASHKLPPPKTHSGRLSSHPFGTTWILLATGANVSS
jgi:hypothetical protein